MPVLMEIDATRRCIGPPATVADMRLSVAMSPQKMNIDKQLHLMCSD